MPRSSSKSTSTYSLSQNKLSYSTRTATPPSRFPTTRAKTAAASSPSELVSLTAAAPKSSPASSPVTPSSSSSNIQQVDSQGATMIRIFTAALVLATATAAFADSDFDRTVSISGQADLYV